MPSPRVMMREPFFASDWKSVNGCRKCAASAACHCRVVRASFTGSLVHSFARSLVHSDMQQQVLALPRRNDLHEFGVLDLLDLGVDGDEGLAERFVQVCLLAQQM